MIVVHKVNTQEPVKMFLHYQKSPFSMSSPLTPVRVVRPFSKHIHKHFYTRIVKSLNLLVIELLYATFTGDPLRLGQTQ